LERRKKGGAQGAIGEKFGGGRGGSVDTGRRRKTKRTNLARSMWKGEVNHCGHISQKGGGVEKRKRITCHRQGSEKESRLGGKLLGTTLNGQRGTSKIITTPILDLSGKVLGKKGGRSNIHRPVKSWVAGEGDAQGKTQKKITNLIGATGYR